MTKYHALVAEVRQKLRSGGDKWPQLDVLDCRSGLIEESWGIVKQLRALCPELNGVNLYGHCEYGHLPSPPQGWRGEWLRDLPGVQRLYDAQLAATLTIWVVRGGMKTASLTQTVFCRADVVLVDSVEMVDRESLSDGALVFNCLTQELRTVDMQSALVDPLCTSWTGTARVASGACVAVVGAGIAGMTVAHGLKQRGFAVTVLDEFDPMGVHGVHFGHAAAALTPVVSADDNLRSQLSRAGALQADRLWRQLPEDIGSNCGALQLEKSVDQRRRVDLEQVARGLDLPAWAMWLSAQQASERAGMRLRRGALWMPGGWLIKIPSLLTALAQDQCLSVQVAKVASVRRHAGLWQVLDASGQVLVQAQAVVLANAAGALSVLDRSSLMPALQRDVAPGWRRFRGLHRLAGEITAIPAALLDQGPRCIVGGDGYVLPAVDGWCTSGGTYVRDAEQSVVSLPGKQDNLNRAGQLLSRDDLLQRLRQSGLQLDDLPGWAGWRAVVGGRLPVVGPVADSVGLYVCTAGASRGLTWSAMQAQLLADHLEGRLPALERVLLGQISLI